VFFFEVFRSGEAFGLGKNQRYVMANPQHVNTPKRSVYTYPSPKAKRHFFPKTKINCAR